MRRHNDGSNEWKDETTIYSFKAVVSLNKHGS